MVLEWRRNYWNLVTGRGPLILNIYLLLRWTLGGVVEGRGEVGRLEVRLQGLVMHAGRWAATVLAVTARWAAPSSRMRTAVCCVGGTTARQPNATVTC